jgi:SAM-dependent methyltransferase
MDTYEYQGQELDLFAHAVNWKQYWASRIKRWIEGDVLEVGAGLGANTALLQNGKARSWFCLEPDPQLEARLADAVKHLPGCSSCTGTISAVSGRQFDTIIYIDVLEHILADRQEMAEAARLLRPQGRLIVLSPAHQYLFSEFDASIGHYRRYDKQSLSACKPPGCRLESLFYLDCAGMLASLANRLVLRQSSPTLQQIKTWDSYIVPVSKRLDPFLGYRLGKTIIAVWQRSG